MENNENDTATKLQMPLSYHRSKTKAHIGYQLKLDDEYSYLHEEVRQGGKDCMGKYCHKYVILFMIYYALFETLDAKHQRLSILDS